LLSDREVLIFCMSACRWHWQPQNEPGFDMPASAARE